MIVCIVTLQKVTSTWKRFESQCRFQSWRKSTASLPAGTSVWETGKYIVEEFASLFGDTPLAQITTWQIEKWKAEEGKRLNPVTVNRRLTVIKHIFKKAVEWDLLKTNPAISSNDSR